MHVLTMLPVHPILCCLPSLSRLLKLSSQQCSCLWVFPIMMNKWKEHTIVGTIWRMYACTMYNLTHHKTSNNIPCENHLSVLQKISLDGYTVTSNLSNYLYASTNMYISYMSWRALVVLRTKVKLTLKHWSHASLVCMAITTQCFCASFNFALRTTRASSRNVKLFSELKLVFIDFSSFNISY